MAALPLFSATVTTSHSRWTYIGAPSEYFLYSDTTNKTCIPIIVITNQHHVLSTAAQPEPPMLHTHSMFQANHIVHTPVLEVMGCGHHKDLRGFTSASFGTLWSTSLLIICSFYYHMLFKLTPYMFYVFPLYKYSSLLYVFCQFEYQLSNLLLLTRSCLS